MNGAKLTKVPAVTTALTADVAQDSKTCEVTSVSGLSVGMHIVLYDSANIGWNATHAVIDTIVGLTLTFTQLPYIYYFGGNVSGGAIQAITVANSASLCATHPLVVGFNVGGFMLDNGRLDGNKVVGEYDSFPASLFHSSICEDTTVKRCTFTNAAQDGVSDQQGVGNIYDGNIISGIDLYGIHIGTLGSNYRVKNNSVSDCGFEAIHYSIGVKGSVVYGNYLHDCPKGIANLTTGNDNNIITHNTIEDCPTAVHLQGGDSNIVIANTITGGQVLVDTNSLNSQVGNNVISAPETTAILVGAAGFCTQIYENVITAATLGIHIFTPSFCTVRNNTLQLETGDGILFGGSVYSPTCSGNIVRTEAGYGINAAGYKLAIIDNHVIESNGDGITVQGEGFTVARNQVRSDANAIVVAATSQFGTVTENKIVKYTGEMVKLNTGTTASSDIELANNLYMGSALVSDFDYGNAVNLLIDGQGDNGTTDPASGGYWNPRGRAGINVIWNTGGTVKLARFVRGVWRSIDF
jgi:hypothetical protein